MNEKLDKMIYKTKTIRSLVDDILALYMLNQ